MQKRDFLKKHCAKVNLSGKNDKGLNNVTIYIELRYNAERWRFAKFIKSRPKYVLYCRFIPLKK